MLAASIKTLAVSGAGVDTTHQLCVPLAAYLRGLRTKRTRPLIIDAGVDAAAYNERQERDFDLLLCAFPLSQLCLWMLNR